MQKTPTLWFLGPACQELAICLGVDGHKLKDENGWPRPDYINEEQLWSAADDAVKGIRTFVGQQGIAVVWQEEDTPDFQQAPTSFDTIVS